MNDDEGVARLRRAWATLQTAGDWTVQRQAHEWLLRTLHDSSAVALHGDDETAWLQPRGYRGLRLCASCVGQTAAAVRRELSGGGGGAAAALRRLGGEAGGSLLGIEQLCLSTLCTRVERQWRGMAAEERAEVRTAVLLPVLLQLDGLAAAAAAAEEEEATEKKDEPVVQQLQQLLALAGRAVATVLLVEGGALARATQALVDKGLRRASLVHVLAALPEQLQRLWRQRAATEAQRRAAEAQLAAAAPLALAALAEAAPQSLAAASSWLRYDPPLLSAERLTASAPLLWRLAVPYVRQAQHCRQAAELLTALVEHPHTVASPSSSLLRRLVLPLLLHADNRRVLAAWSRHGHTAALLAQCRLLVAVFDGHAAWLLDDAEQLSRLLQLLHGFLASPQRSVADLALDAWNSLLVQLHTGHAALPVLRPPLRRFFAAAVRQCAASSADELDDDDDELPAFRRRVQDCFSHAHAAYGPSLLLGWLREHVAAASADGQRPLAVAAAETYAWAVGALLADIDTDSDLDADADRHALALCRLLVAELPLRHRCVAKSRLRAIGKASAWLATKPHLLPAVVAAVAAALPSPPTAAAAAQALLALVNEAGGPLCSRVEQLWSAAVHSGLLSNCSADDAVVKARQDLLAVFTSLASHLPRGAATLQLLDRVFAAALLPVGRHLRTSGRLVPALLPQLALLATVVSPIYHCSASAHMPALVHKHWQLLYALSQCILRPLGHHCDHDQFVGKLAALWRCLVMADSFRPPDDSDSDQIDERLLALLRLLAAAFAAAPSSDLLDVYQWIPARSSKSPAVARAWLFMLAQAEAELRRQVADGGLDGNLPTPYFRSLAIGLEQCPFFFERPDCLAGHFDLAVFLLFHLRHSLPFNALIQFLLALLSASRPDSLRTLVVAPLLDGDAGRSFTQQLFAAVAGRLATKLLARTAEVVLHFARTYPQQFRSHARAYLRPGYLDVDEDSCSKFRQALADIPDQAEPLKQSHIVAFRNSVVALSTACQTARQIRFV